MVPETTVSSLSREQTSSASTIETLIPLPMCEGPKLAPFTQNFEDLKFEPELVIRVEDNVHSLVIKAKLDGKTYGIKFFVRRGILSEPEHYPGISKDDFDLARMQSDPFFAECRAYGRLQEQGVEHLAAKAYGYVKVVINDRTEEMFKPAMKVTKDEDSGLAAFMTHLYDLDSPNPPSTEPIYGIVKEWAGGDKEHNLAWSWARPFEEQMAKHQLEIDRLPRQLENLHELHRNGIVMRDCHSAQWVNGVLVDLSHSWTVPHVLGQGDRHRPDWTFASYAARDLFMFQRVIDCQNESIDSMAGRLHREGVHGPFRKSTLVAYSDDILEASEPFPRREGLRPLPHRLQQRQNEGWAREEDEDDEDVEELPLLLYTEPYDPDSEELPPGWAAWTHGPRWDPARFVSGKQRGHGKDDSSVLWGYIRRIKAMARRDRRSKLKAKSKAEAGAATKTTTKPSTKANTGDKVSKKGGKVGKRSKKTKRI